MPASRGVLILSLKISSGGKGELEHINQIPNCQIIDKGTKTDNHTNSDRRGIPEDTVKASNC